MGLVGMLFQRGKWTSRLLAFIVILLESMGQNSYPPSRHS